MGTTEKKTVKVVYLANPVTRERYKADVEPGRICDLFPKLPDNNLLRVDGREVGYEYELKDGESLEIIGIPQGEGGKDFARFAITIAVIAAATYATGGISSVFWASLAKGALVAGGQLGVNALIPVKKPGASEPEEFNRLGSLSGSQNQVVPYGVVPRVFGRRRIFPPISGRPFTMLNANRQYLRVMFCLGQGPLRLFNPKIGETAIGDFNQPWNVFTSNGVYKDLSVEVGENPRSYANSVTETSPGSEFGVSTIAPAVQTAPVGQDEISVDFTFPQGLFAIDREGKTTRARVTLTVEYRELGGVWVNARDAVGLQMVGFGENPVSILEFMAESGQRETWRGSVKWDVDRGKQYEVRITRGGYFSWGIEPAFTTFVWSALRSVRYEEPTDLPGVVQLALTVRADDDIQGILGRFSVEVESMLPYTDGASLIEPVFDAGSGFGTVGAWSRNPADAMLDLLTGAQNARALSADRIDLASFKAWRDRCAAEGRELSLIVDAKRTVLDMARTIGMVGRGALAVRDGKYAVVEDLGNQVVVQHFTPRNSWGFQSSRVFPEIPHALRVRFDNEAKDYQRDEVIVYDDYYSQDGTGCLFGVPDVDCKAAEVFELLDLEGVTNYEQAWKEGRFRLAEMRLRPERYEFEADIENLICERGDLIKVSHDVTLWGMKSGRVKSVTRNGANEVTEIELDEQVTMETGESYNIRIRNSSNESVLVDLVTVVGTGNVVQTAQLPDTTYPNVAIEKGDLFVFGLTGTETQDLKVLAVEPGNDFTARVICVDASPGIYTADQQLIPPFESNITDPIDITKMVPPAPVIDRVRTDVEYAGVGVRALIDFTMTAGYPTVMIEGRMRRGADAWVSFGQVPGSIGSLPLRDVERSGWYTFQIRARNGELTSDWVEWPGSVLILGQGIMPGPVEGFEASIDKSQVYLRWRAYVGVDLSRYVLKKGTNFTGERLGGLDGIYESGESVSVLPARNMEEIQILVDGQELIVGAEVFVVSGDQVIEGGKGWINVVTKVLGETLIYNSIRHQGLGTLNVPISQGVITTQISVSGTPAPVFLRDGYAVGPRRVARSAGGGTENVGDEYVVAGDQVLVAGSNVIKVVPKVAEFGASAGTRVERAEPEEVGRTDSTRFYDVIKKPGEFRYWVSAVDVAGNYSGAVYQDITLLQEHVHSSSALFRSSAVGRLSGDVTGEVTELAVVLETSVVAGQELILASGEDTFAVTVAGDSEPGEVVLAIESQMIEAVAGAYLLYDMSQMAAFFNVDPSRVQLGVERSREADSVGVLSAPFSGGTSIPISTDKSTELRDGDIVAVLARGGNSEEFVVSGDQQITGASTQIVIVNKTAGTTYPAGNPVMAPAYTLRNAITVSSKEIDLRVRKDGVISAINLSTEGIKIEANQITVAGQTTFLSDLEAEGFYKGDPEGSGNVTIRSATPPTQRPDTSILVDGDIWIDTGNGDKPYSWDTSLATPDWAPMYTVIDGGSITTGKVQAQYVIIGSQTEYETGYNPSLKSFVIRSATAPIERPDGGVLVTGDTWIDTSTGAGNKPYSWDGLGWVASYTAIDGGSITTGRVLAQYVEIGSGTNYEAGYNPSLKSFVIRAASAPSVRPDGEALVEGDMWIDTSDGDKPYTRSGSSWTAAYTSIDGGAIKTGRVLADYVEIGSGTQYADGYDPTRGTDTQRATTAPGVRSDGSPLKAGDIWINTGDGDRPHTWDGVSTWLKAYTIIDGGDIVTGSVSADKIVANSITADQIAANTITATQIASYTITANQIASNTITATQIAANTITADQIAANTITANEISVLNLSAVSADLGSVTAGSIVVGNSSHKLWLNDGGDGALNIGGLTKASAPFRVSATGSLTATGATISGAITATSGSLGDLTVTGNISLTTGKVEALNGGSYVRMSSAGIEGYDNILGQTFLLPTNGSAPVFASGTIKEVTFELYTNAVIRTSDTALSGGAGIVIRQDGFYAGSAGQNTSNANVRILSDGTAYFTGVVVADTGSIHAGLIDAGVINAEHISIGTLTQYAEGYNPVSKTETQRAASAPETRSDGSALRDGDIWLDTSNGDKPYVRDTGSGGVGTIYWTDFSEYTTGVQPSDWTKRYTATFNWEVVADAGATGGKILRGLLGGSNSRNLISWDAIDGDVERDDVEILVKGRMDSTGPIETILRGSGAGGSETGYRPGISNTAAKLDKYVNGSFTSGPSTAGTYSTGTWYWVRARIQGSTFSVKAWADSASEPAGWSVTTTDTSITGVGWVGVFRWATAIVDYDVVSVATGGQTAPMESGVGGWVASYTEINGGDIITGSLTADKIVANSITANQIATGAITANEIAARTITASEIQTGAITANEIAAGTITADEIASQAITAVKIASYTITALQIEARTITADQIATRTITANEITAGTITANEITVSNLSSIKADLGTVTAGSIVIGSTNKLWLNDGGDGALNIGGSTKGSANFRVTATGALTALSATITGAITATSGSITGNLQVSTGGKLYVGSLSGSRVEITPSGVTGYVDTLGVVTEEFNLPADGDGAKISFRHGSQTVPSISFVGAHLTGFYYKGFNEFVAVANGFERLLISEAQVRANAQMQANSFTFSTDTDTGMFRNVGEIRFDVDGVNAMSIGAAITIPRKLILSSANYQEHLEMIRGAQTYRLAPSTGSSSGAANELRFVSPTGHSRYHFDGVVSANTFNINEVETITSGRLIRLPNGTAGAPSFSFTSDPDLGIYTDQGKLSFAADGLLRAYVDFNGIRLNSPGMKVTYGDGTIWSMRFRGVTSGTRPSSPIDGDVHFDNGYGALAEGTYMYADYIWRKLS